MNTNTSNTPNPSPDTSAKKGLPVSTLLRVRHETRYEYPHIASLAYELAWQTPLNMAPQSCLQHKLKIDPKPRFQHVYKDFFGNTVTYFEVHKPHHQLTVVSEAVVERRRHSSQALSGTPWQQCRYDSLADEKAKAPYCLFAYPGPMTPAHEGIARFASECAEASTSIVELVDTLNRRIFTELKYTTGATHTETTVAEVWESREGVCQDFAHIAVVALRSLGLMAAYVSGYLLTYPPDGEEKRIGADASHAWFAVYVPEFGWLHADPTNNIWVDDEHITVAIGRDYSDIPPLKGLCYGGGQLHPEVKVSVERISKEDVEHGDRME